MLLSHPDKILGDQENMCFLRIHLDAGKMSSGRILHDVGAVGWLEMWMAGREGRGRGAWADASTDQHAQDL